MFQYQILNHQHLMQKKKKKKKEKTETKTGRPSNHSRIQSKNHSIQLRRTPSKKLFPKIIQKEKSCTF